jgi:sporulation protein YlmC with PRC-barrel domain
MTTREITEAEAYESHSRTIVDSDGKTLGKVDEIYLDNRTQKPEWATVSSGLLGGKSQFVPLAGASSDGDNIHARVTMKQVKNAPSVQHDRHLSEEEESRLFEHYGTSIPIADKRPQGADCAGTSPPRTSTTSSGAFAPAEGRARADDQ